MCVQILKNICGIFLIFQISNAIYIPNQEQTRPPYTSGIKTLNRKNNDLYTDQNYSKVTSNKPDGIGPQHIIAHTTKVQQVYPVYSNSQVNRHQNNRNILQTQSHIQIDTSQFSQPNRTIIKRKIESKTLEVYSKCPTGLTGQFIYSGSCNQFLNCWKGRGTVQNCAPGTLFNPKSLECDFLEKVECITGPHSNTIENVRVPKSTQQVSCPEGFSGIIPDYFDCSKFINCNNGQPNKMDCAPGTLFDMNKNMCDYPHLTTCFNGENALDIRTSTIQWQHQDKYPLSSQNQYQYQRGEYDGRFQEQGASYLSNTDQRSNSYYQHDRYSDGSFHNSNNGQFNCDLSKPNCGQDQQSYQQNYGRVCNVNDRKCIQNQWETNPPTGNIQPTVNIQPVCPNGAVGMQKHPTDCTKFLNCANGQTFIMDCSPGTLFNPISKICDFATNVHCESSETGEHDFGGNQASNYDKWQTGYETQEYDQHFGQGNTRYTTEQSSFYNTHGNRNENWNQQSYDHNTITESKGNSRYTTEHSSIYNNHGDRNENWNQQNYDQNTITESKGQHGFGTVPPVNNKSPDYDGIYNHKYQSTSRSVWPPPYQTSETNDIDNVDYIFTYDNGDPVILEPENLFDSQKTNKICDDNDFYCTSNLCISLTLVCDGNRDCADSKDERNCHEYIEKFSIKKNAQLVVPENQKWLNVTYSTCAFLCTQNKKIHCRSFNYRRSDRTCSLSDKNIGLSGALVTHQSTDYYELKSNSIDCSDRSKYFECNNKKCISNTYVCDGYNDCENREDEKNCNAETFGYSIRLAGSPEKHEGRIEVTAFNSSGYICDDGFDIADANVICKELGFPLGAAEVKGQSQFAKGLKDSNILYMIDHLNCYGNETRVIDCSFPGWGIHNCRDQEIAGVVCKTPQEKCGNDAWKCDSGNECIPFDFVCDGIEDCADSSDEDTEYCEAPSELRLVGGSYPGEGRIEIKHNGIWGTICDDDFNEDAGKVVCKSLGYKGRSYVKKEAYFGAGLGPIWLDQVSCYGNESELNMCTHWNWGEHNCEHSEDVGVICSQDAEEIKVERHSNLPIRIEEGLPENCGLRKDNQFAVNDMIQARVIGGNVASQGEYPWQAALKVRVKDKSAHWCGAVIISSKWVLTAAHCLQGYTKGAYIIVAGEYNTDEEEGTEQHKYIDEFFIHEKFRVGHKLNNDIALIKVKGTGFELNDDIQPICLANAHTNYDGDLNCTISGFGSVKSGVSAYSHNLLAAWIPINSDEICKMPHVYGDVLTDGMICAGSLDGGLDACDGDSGGPLACLDRGVFTLYGIVSWGQHCGYANKPGVYVKIGHYQKWIQDTISKHSK